MATDYADFFPIGDDYGGVRIVCRKCSEPNTPYRNTRQMRIGYVDMDSVAEIIRLCQAHTHKSGD